jgi:AcrR family transcriptional regulator
MARSPSRGRPKRAYHHGNLPAALVGCAAELIGAHGPEALTLREVAKRAGVSHAAPYRHFKDKAALLAAVAEEGFREMTQDMVDAAGGAGPDPMDRFQATGLAYVRFAVSHPAHFRLMFGPAVPDKLAHPSLAESARQAFSTLMDQIAACQTAGLVRGGDPADLALPAWSIVHGLASLIVDRQVGSGDASATEELARTITAAVMLGLATEPGRRRAQPS